MQTSQLENSSSNTTPWGVDLALEAARHGWRVFPIRPCTKEPYSRATTAFALGIDGAAPAGVHHARTDEASIRALWSDERTTAWIGLAMGSGLLAIDCDEKDGKSGLRTIALNGWHLPTTASQRTPSGGVHFIFSMPSGLVAPTDQEKLGSGLDRRGDGGGYIVLYDPSILSAKVTQAPEWALAKIQGSGEQRTPLGTEQAPSFDMASRALWSISTNDLSYGEWLNVTAAYRQAATGTADEAAIRMNWKSWCVTYSDNEESENEKLWRSLNDGTALGWSFLRKFAFSHGSLSDDDRARMLGLNGTVHQIPAAAIAAKRIASHSIFVRASDLEYRPPEYHISGLIETDALVVLFGDPATGKSFVALDMACCIATGSEFHGYEVQRGSVFYIAGEGRNGIRRRLTAWEARCGIGLADAPLYVSLVSAQFLDEDKAIEVESAIDALTVSHGVPRLVVVDTLARNFGAGDENSQKDMTTFVDAMDRLRQRFPSCTVLIVHHSGHGDKGRARGSSVLRGAVDAEYKVTKTDDRIKLENQKMKDGQPPRPLEFRLESFGHSAALTFIGEPNGQPSNGLSREQKAGWDAFNECGSDAVATADWRKKFYGKHQGSSDAKRKAFQRIRDHLVKVELIVLGHGGAYYHRAPMPGLLPPRGDD